MSVTPFRVGCMGAGQIFNEAHLPAYISLDSVELAREGLQVRGRRQHLIERHPERLHHVLDLRIAVPVIVVPVSDKGKFIKGQTDGKR